ncbi:MAG: VanW family protein [Candidatus Peribacteraceae bacterium]|nr:VanW family protein [Candidatus Peribacteraceae bacterium]
MFHRNSFFAALIITSALFTVHFSLFTPQVDAAPLTYRYQHHIFTIDPAQHAEWRTPTETWTYNGTPFEPPAEWRVDGDEVPALPAGVRRSATFTLNRSAIARTIAKIISPQMDRPAGNVTIRREVPAQVFDLRTKNKPQAGSGKIVFDGVGLTGRSIDSDAAADLTMTALAQGLNEIELPVTETQPVIRVDDPQLREAGITEVVTIGESIFAGSPVNRRHNIGVGLNRFNGTFIPAGAIFSFNAVLGKVDGSTGYRKELVIKGDRTEPDYGGGLCQISTTAYRGIWEYGFPILKRKNHSYTVRYYAPAGTDATVYPGSVDMVFQNDLPNAMLIQTHQEKDRAYFIYYGTRDARKTEIVGPFIYDKTSAPADKIELTTNLPPGEKKKLNERVPGQKSAWYRIVESGTEAGPGKVEAVYSHYEARPLFTALGVAELPPGYGPQPAEDEAPAEEAATSSSAAQSSSSARPVRPSRRR